MSFKRSFKLIADADLPGGYIAELEARHGSGYLTLLFYDEQQNELRDLIEKHNGELMLYLGGVPKATATAEVIHVQPQVWTHSCDNQGCGSSTCESCGPHELQKTKDYINKYRQLVLRAKGRQSAE